MSTEPTSESFLRHAVSNKTQYSEGWRQVCQELLDARARVATLEREVLNLKKHIEDDSFCAAHGVQGCISCEGRCESCGYDALREDMVTTSAGERLCTDCAAIDAEDAEPSELPGEDGGTKP